MAGIRNFKGFYSQIRVVENGVPEQARFYGTGKRGNYFSRIAG